MTYPDGWYVAADASKLGRRPVKLRRFGLELVLWRNDARQPSCLRAACPHRGADSRQARSETAASSVPTMDSD